MQELHPEQPEQPDPFGDTPPPTPFHAYQPEHFDEITELPAESDQPEDHPPETERVFDVTASNADLVAQYPWYTSEQIEQAREILKALQVGAEQEEPETHGPSGATQELVRLVEEGSKPPRIREFALPFDRAQPDVTPVDQVVAAQKFNALVDDTLLNHPDETLNIKHQGHDWLSFVIPVSFEEPHPYIDVRITANTDNATNIEGWVREIAITEYISREVLEDGRVSYRLYPNGVVRRYDHADDEIAVQARRELNANPNLAEMSGEEIATHLKETTQGYLESMKFQKDTGLNLLPVHPDEIDGLTDLLAHKAVPYSFDEPWWKQR